MSFFTTVLLYKLLATLTTLLLIKHRRFETLVLYLKEDTLVLKVQYSVFHSPRLLRI